MTDQILEPPEREGHCTRCRVRFDEFEYPDGDKGERWVCDSGCDNEFVKVGEMTRMRNWFKSRIAELEIENARLAAPSELASALAFLANRLGRGYRVEEIFREARARGWEP